MLVGLWKDIRRGLLLRGVGRHIEWITQTFHLVTILIVTFSLKTRQLNMKNTFLNVDLEECVFMA